MLCTWNIHSYMTIDSIHNNVSGFSVQDSVGLEIESCEMTNCAINNNCSASRLHHVTLGTRD